ncbi:E3 ubiquitin- ligase DZIP3, partial [Paramuricea clavata]
MDLQEKANFTRLSRLLVDKGTEALRNTFDAIHPSANLPAVLNANRASLSSLKPRVINNSQWDLLFPPSGNPPDSKTFDVTLLTILFRNICGLPSTGWGAMPLDTDRSMQANILRLKSFRNKVAHATSTQVDNATFKSLWQKISEVLVELNIPQHDVDDLETSPLGPEEVEIRNEYVEILKEWISKEEEYGKGIECSLNRLIQFTANLEKICSKESDEDFLQKLAKHNFKSKIERKAKSFFPGTREWLLKRVEMFVEKEQKAKTLLLTAGPGDSNLRDPMMMLQSLASQMCENIAGFKEKLLDQLRRPHQVQSLNDAFRIYLENPLDELDLEEPSLVVIDGLDESAADNKNEIMNLIADYFQDLPERMKFLVTSRPEISLAKLSDVQKININSNDAKNNLDLELYLKACLPSLVPEEDAERDSETDSKKDSEENSKKDSEEDSEDDHDSEDDYDSKYYYDSKDYVFKKLAKKCEGSFLYAFYVQSELQKRDDLHTITLDKIIQFVPKGLNSIYLKYFNRLKDELRAIMHDSLDVLRILEMLAVSRVPLPLSFISRALGLTTDSRETRKIIGKVNERVSCFLYVSDDLVTVFHKSVIDWLLAKGYKDHEYTVKVMDGNKSLWLICEKVFEEIKKTVWSGHDLNLTNDVKYALDYGFDYLGACSMEESLFWSVDVIIIYVCLSTYHHDIDDLLKIWQKIGQLDPVVISDKLRERLSWHIAEFDFLLVVDGLEGAHTGYLQSVLTHSPEGYFSDDEKKIAESLLQKVPRFVECILNVEVLPLAAWYNDSESFEAVGLSHDKTMAAAVVHDFDNKIIRVISVPSLVELWHFSLDCIISCCLFAPDDSFILFGKLGTVLNIAERKKVPFFHGNKERFTSCAFSPNGKRLVTSNGYDTIKLWDVSRQSLLASLCADKDVDWCSFSSTGLFIIGCSRDDIDVTTVNDVTSEDSDSFCVWNAITWQRSDERNIRDVKLKEPGVFQDKKCKRCFRSGSKELEIKGLKIDVYMSVTIVKNELQARSTGTYHGIECSFSLKNCILSVIENTHFTTLAAWDFFYCYLEECLKLTIIEDDLWFYANAEKLFVFRTLASIHQHSSRPRCPTRVLSSSFSPDGSRLGTCTSDGYINIWNVHTNQIEQSFKSNQGESSFGCWWSEKFLFMFDFFGRIASLSKYPVDVNLKILFPQSQQVSLCHLLEEFVSLSAIVDFSEGLLNFECGETEPVKVLDVSGVGGPRMMTLPGIEPEMSITVSPGASFVFGCSNESTYYIWKRNAKDVYEVFCTEPYKTDGCCFSNDSKVALVYETEKGFCRCKIFDLDTGVRRCPMIDKIIERPMFCLNKDSIVISWFGSCGWLAFFDMESAEFLGIFCRRYLTEDLLKQLKLSPKETTIAFPKINGDMEFLRLCIPQRSAFVLSRIKREA